MEKSLYPAGYSRRTRIASYYRKFMVYTCFEMMRDCRADLPQGWRHFAAHYVPVIRLFLAHYDPSGSSEEHLRQVALQLRKPESSLFQSLEPAPEGYFVAELRQLVLAGIDPPAPEIPLELESVAQALAPLTMTEKLAAWLEAFRHDAASTGEMLRAAPSTIDKIRTRAAELIRGKVDAWRRTLLAENGLALGREASSARTGECLPAKVFIDILDGRTTWSGREMMERHANECWCCIDHYARMMEVVWTLRRAKPLTEIEALPYYELLGVAESKRPFWKLW